MSAPSDRDPYSLAAVKVTLRVNEYEFGLSPHPLPTAFASFESLAMSVWRIESVTSHFALSRSEERRVGKECQ